MKRIYKYELPLKDKPIIAMPYGAEILSVGEQEGEIVIWAQVDVDNPEIDKYFLIFPTGAEMICGIKSFIGTVQMKSGLVFHVYEKIRK